MPKTLLRGQRSHVLVLLFAVGSVASCAATSATSPIAAAPTMPAASTTARLTPGPTRTPLPDPYEGVVIEEVDAQTVRFLQRDVGYLAVSADSVWVATNEGLVQLDPTTLKPQNVDDVGRFGLAASADAVWVSDFGGEPSPAWIQPPPSKRHPWRFQTIQTRSPSSEAQRGSPNTAVGRSPDSGSHPVRPSR